MYDVLSNTRNDEDSFSDEQSHFSYESATEENPLRCYGSSAVGMSNRNPIDLGEDDETQSDMYKAIPSVYTQPWIGLVGTLGPDDVTHMFEKISPNDLKIMVDHRGPDGYVTLDVIRQLVNLKHDFLDRDEVACVIHHNIKDYHKWHDAFVKQEQAKTQELFQKRKKTAPDYLGVSNENTPRKRGPKGGAKASLKKRSRRSGKDVTMSPSFKSVVSLPNSTMERLTPIMTYSKKPREMMFGLELVLPGEDNIMAINDYYAHKVKKHAAFKHDPDLTGPFDSVAKNHYPHCIGCAHSFIRNEWNVMKPDTTLTDILITNTHHDRDGQSCKSHGNGCGKHLLLNDLVCTMGEDTHLVNGEVYYIGVYKVVSKNVRGCKVGVVKAAYHQLQYFTNRIGVIKEINGGDNKSAQRGIDNGVRGWARMSCVDLEYNFKF